VIALSAAELAAVLRHAFHAEALDDLALRRLHRHWRAFAADPARVAGQAGLFHPDRAVQVVAGLRWWEERQQGRGELVRPITAGDRAAMLFSSEQTVTGAPQPRLYCPAELAGDWQEVGEPGAAPARRVRLHPDERFEDSAAPARRDWRWRVHLGGFVEIWLGPDRLDADRRWWIRHRDGDQLVLDGAGAPRRLERIAGSPAP